MLELFKEYNIHVTWGVVGFLFFDKKEELLKNVPAILPDYTNKNYSPFEYLKEIGENEIHDPFHFGKSLIKIISSFPCQEVASHSFSHYYCLEEGQDIKSFEADLDKSIEVAGKLGFETKSYIFPRNQKNENYLASMKTRGILCYRGEEKCFVYSAIPRAKKSNLKRIIRLIDSYLNISGHNTYNIKKLNNSQPFNIPSSRYLRYYSPVFSFLENLKIKRIKKAMLHAAKHNEMFHLWWHPHNFGKNLNENIHNLRMILEYYQFLNKKYGMGSLNMAEISEKILNGTR